MSDQQPGATPPTNPPAKSGLRPGCSVALIVVAAILLVMGICIAISMVQGGA